MTLWLFKGHQLDNILLQLYTGDCGLIVCSEKVTANPLTLQCLCEKINTILLQILTFILCEVRYDAKKLLRISVFTLEAYHKLLQNISRQFL